MANTDSARGFVPVGHLMGGEIRPRNFRVADGQTIYKGDVVSINGEGEAIIASAGDGKKALGVAAETVSNAVSDDLLVWDDPNIIYEVQGYSGVAFTAGAIGGVSDHVANTASSTYKISRQELNDTTAGTAAPYEDKGSAQFIILGKAEKPGNEWGEHVKLLVKFYEHVYLSTESS